MQTHRILVVDFSNRHCTTKSERLSWYFLCRRQDVILLAWRRMAPAISLSVSVMPSNYPPVDMERRRIMVMGGNVTTVQRVSLYCLEQGAEVFPYYGIPTKEEVTLFAPEVWVLCLPVPEEFRHQICQPYILWSEQSINDGLPLVATRTQLHARLQEVFHLNQTFAHSHSCCLDAIVNAEFVEEHTHIGLDCP